MVFPTRLALSLATAAALLCAAATGNQYHRGGVMAERDGLHHPEANTPFVFSDAVYVPNTVDEFRAEVAKLPLALVFFHAAWSYSSQEFYQHFDDVAKELWSGKPKIRAVAVDVEALPELGTMHSVNSLPTLAAMRYGVEARTAENQLPRDPAGIVAHMRSLLKPPAVELTDMASAKRFVNPTTKLPVGEVEAHVSVRLTGDDQARDKEVVVFAFAQEGLNQDVFLDVARYFNLKFTFCWTEDATIARGYGARFDTLVVYTKFNGTHTFDVGQKDWDRAEMLDFITTAALPPVGVFNTHTKPLYFHLRRPLLLYFTHFTGAEKNPHWDALQAAAAVWKNISFVQGDPIRLGLTVSFLDLTLLHAHNKFAIGLLVGKTKYRYEKSAVDADSLLQWLAGVESGAVPVHHKSAPEFPLPGYGDGEVFELVHSNFRRVVVDDPDRDALLFMYDPDHRGCQELMPIFDAVAETFRGVASLLVGRFDSTANDYEPEYVIPGVPSILFAAANNKTVPIRMTGLHRTVDNIVEFAREHATKAIPADVSRATNKTPSPSIKDDL